MLNRWLFDNFHAWVLERSFSGKSRELTATANGGMYTSRMKPNPSEMVVLTADAGRAELKFKGRDGGK